MKTLAKGFLFFLMTVAAAGCAITGRYVAIPSPQPGLVLPVHSSPAVWAECLLFDGFWSERELITGSATGPGRLAFAARPIKHFFINPPVSQPYAGSVLSTEVTVPLVLPSPAPYTLLIFYTNFRGWVVEVETRQFSTTGYPLAEYYYSAGQRVYADRIILLSRVLPYQERHFIFERTYHPGQVLKSLFGLDW